MENFNKYNFLEALRNDILAEILNENIKDSNDVYEFIHSEIDRSVIYYSDCFDICKELNFTDWSNSQLGDITNICQAAYLALNELVEDEFDTRKMEQAIDNLETFIEWSHSDNCINVEGGKTKTQCTQYSHAFEYFELFKYFVNEYAV
jgi:hypothetical protein